MEYSTITIHENSIKDLTILEENTIMIIYMIYKSNVFYSGRYSFNYQLNPVWKNTESLPSWVTGYLY